MTSRTHKEFAISFVYIATFYIYSNSLIDINYYCLLIIMLCIGAKGALFPDVDHTWRNVKEKTLFNRILNILIHLTGGTHRSWQTHSLDLCLASGLILLGYNLRLYDLGKINELNYHVIKIILLAFYSGWISHLLSDMLTVGGIYILVLKKKKIRLVPKKIGKLEFKTGERWEAYVYNVVNKINTVMSVLALIYPFMVNEQWSLALMNLI